MIASVVQPASKILLVDDSEGNLYVISTWLRRAGYEVTEARLGSEALRLVSTQPFDLAILDVNLPDMTGYVICEHIKGNAETASTPVLHISSTAIATDDRSEGLRRGAEGFLVEPVEREELLATVEALLRAASAQRTAVHLSRRLRRLNEATLVINNARDLRTLIPAIAEQTSVLFGSPAAALTAAEGAPMLALAPPGSQIQMIPVSAKAMSELLRITREHKQVPAESIRAEVPDLADLGETFLAEQLSGEYPGVLFAAVTDGAQTQLNEDLAILSAFAQSATTALRNARSYDIERRIALKLQESLLPEAVLPRAGLEIVTRYSAGGAHVEVGGDFYEIFSLGADRVAIAIGDVAGHSLEAATIMAQLRTAIRCYTLEGHAPDAVLARLNDLLINFHPEVTATVCFGIYEATTGRFEFANAGHLPPLHGTAKGWSFLGLGGTLLGVHGMPASIQSVNVDPGEMLLFYTDGLIERRGENIQAGLERLMQAARQEGALNALCDAILQTVGTDVEDDIALVAVRRTEGT